LNFKIEWIWSGVGVKVYGVGVGMELEILNFSETSLNNHYLLNLEIKILNDL
jgi:hypothetical protein